MADLEDFFAKRDKKKKGKKTEDVARILDAKAKERKNKDSKSNYQAPPSDTPEAPLSDYKVLLYKHYRTTENSILPHLEQVFPILS